MHSLRMLSVVVVASMLTIACGDSQSSMNPAAPSAVVSEVQTDEGGGGGESTVTAGKPTNPGNGNGNGNNGNGNGNGNGKQPTVPTTPTPPGNVTPTAPGLKKVEIEGVITAKAGDSITVNGQTVVVPATCPIRHGSTSFAFSDLRVGDRVHVRASRLVEGSGGTAITTLEATDIKLQNPGSGDDDEVDPTSLVSVSAFDAVASEIGGNTGTFRLTRSGSAASLAAPLTVAYAITGTAVNGTDYTLLPLMATFPANQASVDVVVTPQSDATTEGAEGVILTLTTVTPYDLGSPATATVTITDTDTPLVSVTAFDSTAADTSADSGTFRFSRTGSTAAPLTVTIAVTGSAINGTDYQTLLLSVTFFAGQSTLDLPVVPVPDSVVEGAETVTVTVTDEAAYDLGSPATATVTIAG